MPFFGAAAGWEKPMRIQRDMEKVGGWKNLFFPGVVLKKVLIGVLLQLKLIVTMPI